MENFRDAELKKWLAEEYEKETEEMEKILFPDGVIPDDGETEEEAKAAYQRLVERLKADGVYKEDETDSIKTDDHKENVKIVYLPEKKSHKAARVAAAVLVCSAGIFAASMTSQANRSYFIDSVRYWVGHDTKIVVDNDRTNEKEYEDEQTAIDDIEEELGVDIILESLSPSEGNTITNADDIVKLQKRVGSKALCTMIDVVPPFIANEPYSEYFDKLNGTMKYVDICNSDGATEFHMQLDDPKGVLPLIDFFRILKINKYDGWCSTELLAPYFRDPELYLSQSMRAIEYICKEAQIVKEI